MDCKPTQSKENLKSSQSMIQQIIGKSAKHCVIAAVCLVIYLSDSCLPIFYVIGGILNAILSKILKKIIKEPRPKGAPKAGHGMPSSHSQSIFYFASVLVVSISRDLLNSSSLSNLAQGLRILGMLLIISYSYYACAYRIASGRHTLAQTLVGAVVGIIAGVSASIIETNWLTVYVPTDVLEHAPMQLRYAMIGACLVGLYTRDFIFHVVLGR